MSTAAQLGQEAAALMFKSGAGLASNAIKLLRGTAKGLPTARALPGAMSSASSVIDPALANVVRQRGRQGLGTAMPRTTPGATGPNVRPGAVSPAPPPPPAGRPAAATPPGSNSVTQSFVSPPGATARMSGGSTTAIPPVTPSVKQNWRSKAPPSAAGPTPGTAAPATPASPATSTGPTPSGPPMGPNGLPIINTGAVPSPGAAPAAPSGAGMFESIGAGADALTGGAKSLGSSAGKAYGESLTKNPLSTLAWTGAAGVPAAGAAMEGASALGQFTGMSSPGENSWYAPHLSSLRFDPNAVGEGQSLVNRATSPMQYMSYLMGNNKAPSGMELLNGYNPTTGGLGMNGLSQDNMKVDPATGKVTLQGNFAPGLNPAVQRQLDSRRQMVERLAPQFGYGPKATAKPTTAKPRDTYNGPLLQVGDT